MVEKETKSQRADEKPRDSHGHFIHKESQPSQSPEAPLHKIENLLKQDVHYSKTQDDLLDLHVGNPLRKIAILLEDIKKQKAFSFSIKGSLGIMGVVLVAGTFGVLGVGNVLCDKGIQTKRGVLESLIYKESTGTSILDLLPFLSKLSPSSLTSRTILTKQNGDILHVVLKNNVLFPAVNREQITINPISFFLTGSYDSCSETLTINDANGIQISSSKSP